MMRFVLLHIVILLSLQVCGKQTRVRITKVHNASELKQALANAKPGDEIEMADGNYDGKFVINTSVAGTKDQPIILKGSRDAVLNAGNINTGYVLHVRASNWQLKGFTITNGLKGIMIDSARFCLLENIKVFNIGEEGIHLRKTSSLNTIRNCEITQTGLKTPGFGEGIYIGSAKNNWANYSNGEPDRCDSNKIIGNKIGPSIAAECIDIKEGTTGNIISENTFDATGITGANSADSWIDVKGNNTLIEKNSGFNPGGEIFKNGYEVHCAVDGWGNNNEFINNKCEVNGSGYGFSIQLKGSNGTTTGNKVFANNTVTGAARGTANVTLMLVN